MHSHFLIKQQRTRRISREHLILYKVSEKGDWARPGALLVYLLEQIVISMNLQNTSSEREWTARVMWPIAWFSWRQTLCGNVWALTLQNCPGFECNWLLWLIYNWFTIKVISTDITISLHTSPNCYFLLCIFCLWIPLGFLSPNQECCKCWQRLTHEKRCIRKILFDIRSRN